MQWIGLIYNPTTNELTVYTQKSILLNPSLAEWIHVAPVR